MTEKKRPMNLEVLVSAVDQEAAELIPEMHIHTDAVLVNQDDNPFRI